MTFYTVTVKDAELQDMTVVLEEDIHGQWVMREEAEQAVKDAVADERLRRKQEYWESREIIDKLESENAGLRARLLDKQH